MQYLPEKIKEQQEKLKEEMIGKWECPSLLPVAIQLAFLNTNSPATW